MTLYQCARHKFARLARASLGYASLCVSASSALADTDLIFCNKTGAQIQIAMAYQDAKTGRWMLSAWHERTPGECKSVGNMKSGLFYYYAEKADGKAHWPSGDSAEKNYCVPRARVLRDMANSSCAPGDKSYGFRGRVMDPGKYTFSFS